MATPSISEYEKQMVESLEQASSLVGPVMQAAIDKLHLPPGSCGLEIGCGIGLQARESGQVVGILVNRRPKAGRGGSRTK